MAHVVVVDIWPTWLWPIWSVADMVYTVQILEKLEWCGYPMVKKI